MPKVKRSYRTARKRRCFAIAYSKGATSPRVFSFNTFESRLEWLSNSHQKTSERRMAASQSDPQVAKALIEANICVEPGR